MPIFSATDLRQTVSNILTELGSTALEAAQVADNLVTANLTGHDSHGVGMVPRYVDSYFEGGLSLNQHVHTTLDSGALLMLNGQQGFGQVMGYEAIELAASRAKAHGVCIMGLSNAHHIGRIGAWAEQAAAHGLVSIHFVNVMARPIVAPWGGGDGRHGTNPFCVGIPQKNAAGENTAPVILDFATSRIAQGKTRVAHNKGVPVDAGTLIDDQGRPTTNPRYSVIEPLGAILPFGEHKGSGLALVCELLGGALAGGNTWHPNAEHDGRANKKQIINGMLSILIDPNKTGSADNLYSESRAFIDWFKASPAADGAAQVQIAGEPERAKRAERSAKGIDVDDTTWAEIQAAAQKVRELQK